MRATNKHCSGLKSVTIPNSVKSIGGSAFSGCSGLKSVTIPNSVTCIRGSAFSGCSGLKSVTIPNSVTNIEDYAFGGCTGLTSVTIGNSVTSIGDRAFANCTGLTDMYCYATAVPKSGSSLFYNVPQSTATLHVPAESIELYKAADQWKEFFRIVALTEDDPKPSGIEELQESSSKGQNFTGYYDLSGRKSSTPHKGINIIDGKKVIY